MGPHEHRRHPTLPLNSGSGLCPRIYPRGTYKIALSLADTSLVVWVCHPVGKKAGKEDLEMSPPFYPAPPKITQVLDMGPLLEKGPLMLTLWSVVIPTLQYLAPAVGTEGGQAGCVVLQARTKATGRRGVL